MKSRREILSALLIDVAKAVFITLVVGRIVNPEINWCVTIMGIVATVSAVIWALIIHPKAEVDREWKLWK